MRFLTHAEIWPVSREAMLASLGLEPADIRRITITDTDTMARFIAGAPITDRTHPWTCGPFTR